MVRKCCLKNFNGSDNNVRCERHWPENYSATTDYEKLRPCDPTSVFYCIKSSLRPTVSYAQRKGVRAHNKITNIIADELHLFEQKDRIKIINNIQQKLKPAKINNVGLIMYKCHEKLFT